MINVNFFGLELEALFLNLVYFHGEDFRVNRSLVKHCLTKLKKNGSRWLSFSTYYYFFFIFFAIMPCIEGEEQTKQIAIQHFCRTMLCKIPFWRVTCVCIWAVMDFIYPFQFQFVILRDEEETEQFPIRIFTQLCTLDYTKISAARDLSHFLIEISRSHFPRSPLMYLYWYFSHFLIEISRSSVTFNVFVIVFVPLFNRNLKVPFSSLTFNVFVIVFVPFLNGNLKVSFSLLKLNVFVFVFVPRFDRNLRVSFSLLTLNVSVFVFVPLLNRNLRVSFASPYWIVFVQLLNRNLKVSFSLLTFYVFLAVQDATLYSGDKIDKKDLSTGR